MAKLLSKENWRKIAILIVPFVAHWLVKLIFLTCKKKLHINHNGSDKPSVYICWHGQILMMVYGFIYYAKRRSISAVISQHFDGEMIARFVELSGGDAIRGSSSKGGANVLRLALKTLQNGRDIGITPDGPRGPRHSIADGVAILATKKKVPIIAISCKPSSYWRLKSWDQFCIPKPFCTLEYYYSDPFFVHELTMQEAKALIKERLMEHAI